MAAKWATTLCAQGDFEIAVMDCAPQTAATTNLTPWCSKIPSLDLAEGSLENFSGTSLAENWTPLAVTKGEAGIQGGVRGSRSCIETCSPP